MSTLKSEITSQIDDADKIAWLLDFFVLSQTKLAERLGKSPQYINDICHGRKKITRELAEDLHRTFKVQWDWLLLGIGDPITSTESLSFVASGKDRELYKQVRDLEFEHRKLCQENKALRARVAELEGARGQAVMPDIKLVRAGDRAAEEAEYVTVPLMADAAAAGEPRVMDEEVERQCIIHRRVAPHPENLRAVWIEGESMWPPLPSRSIVVVDVAQRDRARCHGHIVAARIEDGVTIKWGYWHDHTLNLVPGNPDRSLYPIYTIDLRQTPDAIIGRVTFAWTDYSRT